MSAWGVVVAAGRGARAGLGHNKVFYKYRGRSILSRCLDAMASTALLEGVVLVISAADDAAYSALARQEGACPLVKAIVHGGESRRDSVLNGLRAVPEDVSIVAVHDAARPFVTRDALLATIESAEKWGSGVISTPVVDTIKYLSPDGTVTTPERERLRAVQTPQTFRRDRLLEAHLRARDEGLAVTDDAMLFEHYFGTVRLVTSEGAARNIKLTTRADFEMLEKNASPAFRIGQGYDAHRLVEGRDLVLCGVKIPHARGLDGHSDADVAVHALMDALLGALALGDIGRHFPDNDLQYKGISSMRLLDDVMGKVRESGWRVSNADVTIVAQKPKLLPFLDAMRDNLAGALGVAASRVNVKATTTERMGFEGEEQGISAQSVVLLTESDERRQEVSP